MRWGRSSLSLSLSPSVSLRLSRGGQCPPGHHCDSWLDRVGGGGDEARCWGLTGGDGIALCGIGKWEIGERETSGWRMADGFACGRERVKAMGRQVGRGGSCPPLKVSLGGLQWWGCWPLSFCLLEQCPSQSRLPWFPPPVFPATARSASRPHPSESETTRPPRPTAMSTATISHPPRGTAATALVDAGRGPLRHLRPPPPHLAHRHFADIAHPPDHHRPNPP